MLCVGIALLVQLLEKKNVACSVFEMCKCVAAARSSRSPISILTRAEQDSAW